MDEVVVRRTDIDALAAIADRGELPAADLMHALVTAIRTAFGRDDVAGVSVEVEAVAEEFDAAYRAKGRRQVNVTVLKIGR
ncbi:hypothetical protein [Actinoplanes utahensis]|uniref:Uncharacterized protein n=1 Tax=Actinoplanes utahensis TaxID=1869 RepID=A0A0A6XD08_ACTUT|nr:hypothetical protein [Actinoplanes utahensis]KHD77967.1 hypothetical protein MB27_07530 [Actinoplanes utahensis]GIF29941.1 hypothetical protein Aut01nite_29270 [Actinoplanes utahensis]